MEALRVDGVSVIAVASGDEPGAVDPIPRLTLLAGLGAKHLGHVTGSSAVALHLPAAKGGRRSSRRGIERPRVLVPTGIGTVPACEVCTSRLGGPVRLGLVKSHVSENTSRHVRYCMAPRKIISQGVPTHNTAAMKVLVSGGAGYIGSHTCLEMLEAGMEVVVFDSLYNATQEALRRVESITGKKVTFHQVDLLDVPGLDKLFEKEKFDAVIHFAGLKAVGESVSKPLFYYENNITGTVNLLKAMTKADCKNIVFSSSATVYGDPATVPVKEDFPISATNPYGRTKLFIEEILR